METKLLILQNQKINNPNNTYVNQKYHRHLLKYNKILEFQHTY